MTQDSDGLVTTGLQSIDLKLLKDGTEVGHTNALPPRLLSYEAASAYLSLSYWSVRTMVTGGQIPHIRSGKRILIDVQDLDIWIEQHKEIGV